MKKNDRTSGTSVDSAVGEALAAATRRRAHRGVIERVGERRRAKHVVVARRIRRRLAVAVGRRRHVVVRVVGDHVAGVEGTGERELKVARVEPVDDRLRLGLNRQRVALEQIGKVAVYDNNNNAKI